MALDCAKIVTLLARFDNDLGDLIEELQILIDEEAPDEEIRNKLNEICIQLDQCGKVEDVKERLGCISE